MLSIKARVWQRLPITLVYVTLVLSVLGQQEAYSPQPLSPAAIPSVAIIGTAKAGTTDLYTLLTRTSHTAVCDPRKRTKEAKLLVEDGRTLLPGTADFHEYLLRICHPCAASAHPQHSNTSTFTQCIQQLKAPQGLPLSTGHHLGADLPPHEAPTHGVSAGQALPLSIDATPIYLALPRAVSALRALSNDTKVIVLLRHPLDRAESLYNHRVNTEHNHHLPTRVSDRTITEWAQAFLEWVDGTPGVHALLSGLNTAVDVKQQAALYEQLVAANILGLPEGPLNFPNYNNRGHIERNIFGTALYGGALSVWRAGYFRPGRVMVVDSHEYFAQRLAVMDQVYQFVHGRPLSQAGKHVAQRTALQNARRASGIIFEGSKLHSGVKKRLHNFYQPHVEHLLDVVLPALRQEGAVVVGFDKTPWVLSQQH